MLRKGVIVFLVGVTLHPVLSAHGAETDYVDAGNAIDQDFGTWAIGDGTQSVTDLFCTASANYNRGFSEPIHPPLLSALDPDPQRYPYQFKVTDLSTPAGSYIYLDGDDTNTGNARILVQFEHRDVKEGTTYELLSDDTYDTHSHLGQYKNCNDGNNSELRVTLSSAQLQQARAGSYLGNFRIGAIGGTSGTAVDTDDFSVQVAVSQAAQVSRLDNVNLGIWDGVSNITVIEPFCVYSNNAAAAYSITISSPNQDAGNNFYLTGASASVPYQLQFKDDVTAGGGTTVGGAALSGNGSNTVPGCSGIDNAKLTVNVQAADLAGAVQDNYDDIVTLVVVPQ